MSEHPTTLTLCFLCDRRMVEVDAAYLRCEECGMEAERWMTLHELKATFGKVKR